MSAARIVPEPIARLPNRLFQSREKDAADALQMRLDTAHRELADAEQALRDAALEVGLADDPAEAARPYRERITAARAQIELLEDGLDAATQAEEARKRRVAADLRAGKNRSIRQKLAGMRRAAEDFQIGWKRCVEAFDLAVERGNEIRRLLPGGAEGFAHAVGYPALRALFEAEMARQGYALPEQEGSRTERQSSAPGTSRPGITFYPKTHPKLAAVVEARFINGHFATLTGRAPTTLDPEENSAEQPMEADPEDSAPTLGERAVNALNAFFGRKTAEATEAPESDLQAIELPTGNTEVTEHE